jgi:hypothetical protein
MPEIKLPISDNFSIVINLTLLHNFTRGFSILEIRPASPRPQEGVPYTLQTTGV